MRDKKTVIVAGTATINWTCHLPVDRAREANMCADPAVEAVIEAMPQTCQIYVWGQDKEPVDVNIEIDERDVEVEDDDRT